MPPFNIPSLTDVDRSIRSHVSGAVILASSSTNTKFDLDTSGVAGFFGGDVALSAMVTSHIYAGRRWLCWYNQPGSFEVARRYGQLAQSRFWDALYPGPNVDPASLFHFHTKEHGPEYIYFDKKEAASSYTTGYTARLFLDHCKLIQPCEPPNQDAETAIGSVTVVELETSPETRDTAAQLPQTTSMKVVASVPIMVSLATSTLCALLGDWYCCSMILFGMACNGIACCIAGRGALHFRMLKRPNAKHMSARTGILHDGNELVIIKGTRRTLNAITQGRFQVHYNSHPKHHDIGCCALLLSSQLLAQLLVVPQGHLFGQLLFLISLAVSWAYNSYLSSPDIATLLCTVLFERVLRIESAVETPAPGPQEKGKLTLSQPTNMKKYSFGTRTTTVVFALLVIAPCGRGEGALRRVLDRLLTNNAPVWTRWKDLVEASIEQQHDTSLDPSSPPELIFSFDFSSLEEELQHDEDLRKLCTYADDAAAMYQKYRASPPEAKGPEAQSEDQGDDNMEQQTQGEDSMYGQEEDAASRVTLSTIP
ncbi:hypothetical protein TRAPUB_12309 [Trametes pubescens]|uniref:Uncharacterized protein n=1 Tax=Trametes pubescens TaxID=154538 RepID=A0A1M2VUA3_TRAPU|nr:hypothetical protein TRAPUB_12309 [Trametes pubescens]